MSRQLISISIVDVLSTITVSRRLCREHRILPAILEIDTTSISVDAVRFEFLFHITRLLYKNKQKLARIVILE